MGADSITIGSSARTSRAPFLSHQLGPVELTDFLIAEPFGPSLGARERIVEPVLHPRSPRRLDRDERHLLYATGNDNVLYARHESLREVDRLLGGSALAVDRGARDVLGQAGRQPARSRDVAGLPSQRVETTEDHVFHRSWIDRRPVDQCREGMRGGSLRRIPAVHDEGRASGPARGVAREVDVRADEIVRCPESKRVLGRHHFHRLLG